MKYLPTINLWADGITTAILAGQLKLQRGQWVKCGKDGDPARFVQVKSGRSIWVAHSEGDRKTTDSFKRLCSVA